MHATFRRNYPAWAAVAWLAALLCAAPFDLALHDAYGQLLVRPTYATYGADCLGAADLSAFLEPAAPGIAFSGRYPADFLARGPARSLPAWHLVGGEDPLEPSDLTGVEPDDGYPVMLRDWIRRDGLRLRQGQAAGRRRRLGPAAADACRRDGRGGGGHWLSADFNCTVLDPAYVAEVLDRLLRDDPRTYGMLLYVEEPFPYDLERHRLDVPALSARKPLFLDESAHDWRLVRLGRRLGWTGVALKTCKTQTGALLSLCWARAHGMHLMVQDLTNPMLAQLPHLLLAAHAGTFMGVETNSMQFYPEASLPEARVRAVAGAWTCRRCAVQASAITSRRSTAPCRSPPPAGGA